MAEFVISTNMVIIGDIDFTEGVGNEFRFPNQGTIRFRNFADNANLTAISVDDGDILRLGTSAGIAEVNVENAPLTFGASSDVKLFRDGPWELALRDGINDNFFYVYGTFTDSSNYERLALYAGTSVDHFLEPQSAGTGNDNIGLTVRQLGIETLTLGPATIVSGQQTHIRTDRKRTFLGVGNAEVDYTTARQVTGALSGASFTFTNIIPSGVLVKAVLTKVTTAITGATGYDVGDGTDVDRWAANVLPNLGQGSDVSRYTDPAEAPHYTQSQEDVVITALTSDFTGGEVTCIVIYESIAHNNIL